MYGSTFLVRGEDSSKALETLDHAHRLLRSNLQITLMLADAYVARTRISKARDLIATVLAWSHSEVQIKKARQLLEEIDGSTGVIRR